MKKINFGPLKRKIIYENPNYRFTCHYCGVDLVLRPKKKTTPNDWTMDHHLPKSKGGTEDIHNIIYCCLQCNHKRGSLMNKSVKNKIIRIENYLKIKPNLHPDFFKYLFNASLPI